MGPGRGSSRHDQPHVPRKLSHEKCPLVTEYLDLDFRVLILFFSVQAEALESPKYLPAAITMDEVHFKECLIELLQDMFGEESVPKALAGDTVTVTVDSKDAVVSLQNMTV